MTRNPKVLGEGQDVASTQKWLGEGAKSVLGAGSEKRFPPV